MSRAKAAFVPCEGRLGWHLLGFGLGAFAAVCVWPATRPIARQQVAAALRPLPIDAREIALAENGLTGGPQGWLLGRITAVASRRPNDVALQVAAAILAGRRVSDTTGMDDPVATGRTTALLLRPVATRFPGNSLVLAALTKYWLDATVPFDALNGYGTRNPMADVGRRASKGVERTDELSALDTAIREGQIADPANAYFPAAKAVMELYARQNAPAAEAAIGAAASLPRWHSYRSEIVRGLWRLAEAIFGTTSSVLNDRLAYQYGAAPAEKLSEAAGVLVFGSPIPTDAESFAEHSIALRSCIARLGAKIRDRADSFADARLGVVMIRESERIPTDAARAAREAPLGQVNIWDRAHVTERASAYAVVLRAHGHSAEARWVLAQPDRDVYVMLSTEDEDGFWRITDFAVRAGLIGHGLLAECIALALLGALAAGWRYRRRFDLSPHRPLAAPAAWGIAVPLCAAPVLFLLAVPYGALSVWAASALTLLLAVAVLGLLALRFAGHGMPQLVATGAATCGILFVTLLVLATDAGRVRQVIGAMEYMPYTAPAAARSDNTSAQEVILLTAIALSPVTSIGLLLAGVAAIRRRPIAMNVGTMFGRLSTSLLALALLGYCVATVVTARIDRQAKLRLERSLQAHGSG